MTVMSIKVDDAQTLSILKDGKYEMEVQSAEWKTSERTGNMYLNVRLEATENRLTEDVYTIIMHPDSMDTDKKKIRAVAKYKTFCEAFDFDAESIDTDDMAGATGWCQLKTGKDQNGEDRNEVQAFIKAR